MIYTIGAREAYDRYLKDQGAGCEKLGRTTDYEGGRVWKTREEAESALREGFAVYGVLADWDVDTAPDSVAGISSRRLVRTSQIVAILDAAPLNTGAARVRISEFVEAHGMGWMPLPRLLADLRDAGLGTIQIAAVLGIIDSTCHHCWNADSSCRCWDDS